MATKVGLENNILKLDDGVKILYWNASWVNMDFSGSNVVLSNEGRNDKPSQRAIVIIPFTDFQDLSSTPINTEETIATYLSDKIG